MEPAELPDPPTVDANQVARTLASTRRLAAWLLVPVLVLLVILSILQLRQSVHDAERESERQVDAYAQELALLATPAVMHIRDLRATMEAAWDAPPDPGPALAQALHPAPAASGTDGLSLDDATPAQRAAWGQVWWAEPGVPAPPADWTRRAAVFAAMARAVHSRAPDFENSWFAAMDVNTSFGYPWLSTTQIRETMGVPTLTAIAPIRAKAALSSRTRLIAATVPAALASAPSRWGAPYVSQLNGHLVVSHIAPVVVHGGVVGEVSLDLRIDTLQHRVDNWKRPGTHDWIVDPQHRVLADTELPLVEPGGTGHGDAHLEMPLAERLPAGLGLAEVDAALAARGHVIHRGGWQLVAAAREGSPWIFLRVVPESTLRIAQLPGVLPNAAIALALLAMFLAGQWLLARTYVNPAMQVLAYLQRLARDPNARVPALNRRWRPWIAAIGDTLRLQHELQRRGRLREAFKSAIVDHALSAIVATDSDGHIVEFNPAAEAMFGHRLADVLGQPVDTMIIPERLRPAHRAGMKRLRDSGVGKVIGHRMEMPALRADGSELWVEMVIWRTEVDGMAYYSASMADLTQRRQAAEQIERQRDALRQGEKLSAMGGLLAGVAHELNNPLAIVVGRATLLEEQIEQAPLKDGARRIREAAERCARIVRTFLNMARSRPPQRRPAQLGEIAASSVDLLGYLLRTNGIRVDLDLARDLPPLEVDADRIGQIVVNLLVNAQHALAVRSGDRVIHVSTYLCRAGARNMPCVALRVRDNGPGVPDAARARLFEPFFTTKPDGLGTGLGLSVSRSLAQEHGGELVLEPEDGGEGASFLLTLPLAQAHEGAPAAHASAPASAGRELAVLVVDDEAEIADLLRAMLEEAGHEVSTAESGLVALELLDMARFDAIVSDLRMPDMDGAELWRQVRERHPGLADRMVFVTGDMLSASAQAFLDRSGCARLDKPFSKEALLAQVQAAAEHRAT
jgi:PAS domain S-box-containing protein